MDIFKMIDDLDENSTLSDFKNLIKAMQEETGATIKKKDEEIKSLSEKLQKLLEESANWRKREFENMKPEEKSALFLKSAWKSDLTGVAKSGGKLVTQDWGEVENWNMFLNAQADQKAALGTVLRGDAVTGSYLVPTEWYDEVMRLSLQASTMMGKVTTLPMGRRKMEVQTGATGVTLVWPSDESSAKSETNPTFGQKDLEAKTCAGWLTWTEELEEDSTINLVQYFQKLFAEAWGQEFDKQVLTANAAPFTGMLHDTGVQEVIMGAGKTSFSDVTYEDLLNLQDALTMEAHHIGAIYIMHRTIFNVIRKLTDDDGQPIYQKMAEGVPATIAGVPYILADQMPKVSGSAASTSFIIYGNPKHWLHGEKVGMEFKIYRDTIRNVDYDQIFLRFRIRQGFVGGIPSAISRLKTAAS